MNNLKPIESTSLFQEFQICTQLQYNGQLNIKSSEGKTWLFYYRLGQLVWATGGTHPSRRLRRNLAKYCPYLDISKLNLSPENTSIEHWDYHFLDNLLQGNKIKAEQINAIVENTISELLFDLAQQANSTSLTCQKNQNIILEAPISSTTANMFFRQMQDFWDSWSNAGLASFSPDLAPVLVKPEELKRQVSPLVYKNFETFLNGKHTLWDLSVKMKQSVIKIAHSLLPYINQGITALVEVPDLPLLVMKVKNNYNSNKKSNNPNAPLIACIDDSPQVCQMLERIVISNGMRFIKIEDPLQALPILIENKPDFIFLDLIMPGINGYELCATLRRTSLFAKTPIVILTGSDGVFDRVRSKVFGATDFMNKPVATDKLVGIVDKYLGTVPTIDNLSNLAFCS
ncbi:response regulator [Anabaena catenula]|uniref:Protein PatA n=1 Tax=Anabaena catenula FACHB-362 TaxID=2692877 RepID=A0ABR8IZ92_9NOST|nr:response regulator [Anabaena catenula]MBD2691419.1 response regulator [Anabaena catenula FACHB-362]